MASAAASDSSLASDLQASVKDDTASPYIIAVTEPIDKRSPSIKHANTSSIASSEPIPTSSPSPAVWKKGYEFWLIFLAICVATLLVALDLAILSTALPSIAADLESSSLFVSVSNAYTLSSTAIQPLYGQAANIFGRRSLTLFAVSAFLLGSGLCGGASSTAMLVAGRAIQGIGGGGIISLGEIIVCDLVPLRERGKYTGLIAATYAIGTVLGPILGGVFTEDISWRWIFYINLPIGGAALGLIAAFLNLKYPRQGTILDRVRRIDFAGNSLLIASVTSMLLALSTAGTEHPWSSWQVLVPLFLGAAGLAGFGVLELSGLVAEPTLPASLFGNRTSISILCMGFLHGALLIWVTFFLPVYWQAVRENSPIQSGIKSLPISFTIAPFAGIAGAVMSMTGRYRGFHFAGFGMMAIACGCFSLYDTTTSTAVWVIIQLIFGTGCGIVYSTMIPPLLASLPSKDVATAASIWTFTRAFGSIWGVAIPAAIFNAHIDSLVRERLVAFPEIAALLAAGGAYERATRAFMVGLRESGIDVDLVKGVYLKALNSVWYASVAFAVLGLLPSLGVQNLELTMAKDEDFGIERKEERRGERGEEKV